MLGAEVFFVLRCSWSEGARQGCLGRPITVDFDRAARFMTEITVWRGWSLRPIGGFLVGAGQCSAVGASERRALSHRYLG
jgi:hypothetical protein